MDPNTFLYNVPLMLIDRFCKIMDTGCHRYGWRALASRILPSFTEVRQYERVEAAGRSPTEELLWSWAQQNARVGDLLKVLKDMDHYRAIQLFQGQFQAVKAQPPITLRDIRAGTRDFHPEMRISEGSFSDVYLARIGGDTFAVKLFKQVHNTSWKTLWDFFQKEMEIHQLCRHPNVLVSLGCFSDERRYCLLYPYLAKGSLFRRLHRRSNVPPLSWEERFSIIKGVAKALHHLHTSQACAVICGNVSSSNVLLDDTLQPKLSDVCLARLRPHSVDRRRTATLDAGFHSHPGYLPEEYLRNGKLSTGLDVFSFGTVVMETMTGRKAVEQLPKHTLLRDLLTSEAEDSGSVDSCLQFLDPSAGRWPPSLARSLLDLSLKCVASHNSRPSMENVLQALSRLLPPPPSFSSPDRPRSLDDGPSPSIPEEHDELLSVPGSPARPCECSQSEVTYRSVTEPENAPAKGVGGPSYKSLPVQCSCQAETGSLSCEDCRANGFSSTSLDSA
ncbi:interleukin-1 receptor-associated kinase 3 isoform X2 [Syngnathoides biaculeatus]|uniref:interleukin-1 receptor-associated kinase 3 isoform X2 n=1 Tax=Syngnathoides biaculeatus TaxID=300417 RepID=UPI002ADD9549|nr:interleukin-1 receptor-associated kinase 3 isoform X2 [Syngnathoides biaculeatus]